MLHGTVIILTSFAYLGLLFGYPLLALFNTGGTVLGIPVLYAYLFGAWTVLVVLMALVVERSS